MACKLCLLLSFSYTLLALISILPTIHGKPQVPCFFIFGDSLVDNGNNNDLITMAKANYPPYGIDFPLGPTGRFTNGRNIVDFIAEYLGFPKYIQPFATAKGGEIIQGVNYGSGAAGIRDETGSHQGDIISMNRQLVNHGITISNLVSLLGNETSANDHLSKCLYTINIGSNDYINNYLFPQFYNTSSLYTPDEYATLLILQYFQQIQALYSYGARKIGLFGLGPIGCIPGEVEMYGTNRTECVQWINDAVQLFNDKLKLLVAYLNGNLSHARFLFIDVFGIGIQPSNLPVTGLRILNQPCCKVSTNMSKGQCIPESEPCKNRALHLFWDNFHPTETVNLFTSVRAYEALLPLILSP